MTDTLDIGPCPKCSDVRAAHRVSSDGEIEWISCIACGHEGDLGYSKAEAVRAWNKPITQDPTKAPAVSERELLPCPFCGDSPSVIEMGDPMGLLGEPDGYVLILCQGSCGPRQNAGNGNLREHRECEAEPECEAPTLAEAAQKWNTRLAHTAPEVVLREAAARIADEVDVLKLFDKSVAEDVKTLLVALAQPEAARVGGDGPRLRKAAIEAALKMSELIGDGHEDMIPEYDAICAAVGVDYEDWDDQDDGLRAALAAAPAPSVGDGR